MRAGAARGARGVRGVWCGARWWRGAWRARCVVVARDSGAARAVWQTVVARRGRRTTRREWGGAVRRAMAVRMARSSGAECAPRDGGTARRAAVVRQGGSGVCSARGGVQRRNPWRAVVCAVRGMLGGRTAGGMSCGVTAGRRHGSAAAGRWHGGAAGRRNTSPRALQCVAVSTPALRCTFAPRRCTLYR